MSHYKRLTCARIRVAPYHLAPNRRKAAIPWSVRLGESAVTVDVPDGGPRIQLVSITQVPFMVVAEIADFGAFDSMAERH